MSRETLAQIKLFSNNENYLTYEADICKDALMGTKDIFCKFLAILADICRHR